MTLAKRRLGRRLAGAGVAAASLMLGLEAPAFAAPPTISSFSPTSGPAGCVVVITGTNFKDPMVTSVDIGGTPVSEFKVVSGKEIWATVAGDASGTIHVTNASATASSPTDFTNANPGGCSPTITFVTPCGGGGGPAGSVVTILGTNLLKSSGTATSRPVSIGSNVWIGAAAIALPGVSVGDDSIIGAGSVVTRDIPEGVVAMARPAASCGTSKPTRACHSRLHAD
jgi:Hexapeptide repeat of succinyl-transferase/IPT/TIG domain